MGDFLDKISKIPLSQKVLLLLVVMTAVGIGFYALMYRGLEEQLTSLQQQNVDLTTQVAQVRQKRVERDAVRSQWADLQADEQSIELGLPASPDIAGLYQQLETIAEEVQSARLGALAIRNIGRGQPVRQPDHSHIPITLNMQGSYNQVLEYCWRLATLESDRTHTEHPTQSGR